MEQEPKKMIQVRDDKGGYVEVEQNKYYNPKADAKRQQELIHQAQEVARWDRVGTACERFDTLQKVTGKEMALSEEEMVAAMYLSLLNWQYFYPEELGGMARFQEVCAEVQTWFNDHKDD
jgi:hypothetical protein